LILRATILILIAIEVLWLCGATIIRIWDPITVCVILALSAVGRGDRLIREGLSDL
jgi:hypothetical protein